MTKSPHKEANGGLLHISSKGRDDDVGIQQTLLLDGSNNKGNSRSSWGRQTSGKGVVTSENHMGLMKKSPVVTILVALPLLFVAISLGWIVVPCFLKFQISNKVVISPEANPELYEAWIHPPVPVFLKVYLYNVTNSEDVRRGALPKLQELGPYVFRENRTKIDIKHDDPSDTVMYKEYISYHFEQSLSGNLRLEDVVTILNVPFVAAAIKITHDLPWPINSIAQTVLISYKEPLFINKTVDEALFKGWRVPFLEKIEEDVGISLIPNNTFGFFIGQNDTAQGPFTVSRGTHEKSSFGEILKFKNRTEMDFWGDRTSSCNQIRGTDGTIFPPFVNKSSVLKLFNADLCRSLYLTYEKDTEFKGIKAYRFTAPKSILKDPKESEENRCFCQSIDYAPNKCLKQGALDLGPCREGAPVAMSTPHFLDANPEYIEHSGLVPEREKHETYMKIEPLTGAILEASKRIQINLILKKVKEISSLSKIPEMLFPLVWADECASLDADTTERFKSTLFQLWLVEFSIKWILLGIALIISAVLIIKKLRRQEPLSSPEMILKNRKHDSVVSRNGNETNVDG